ncbi:hypothetical protein [Streptomyces sp. NBC_01481]|uniref:hypothetical protein n=1 Tax=Streptomyces sp. NBC_01481 TaxID=2975869 RepID=UPI002253469A|nr:hypothetical protein [Streptomyces sp. NBC_01481]MCX4581890.1 hypothetical protein [Streptomyces sp. NBC_01481]
MTELTDATKTPGSLDPSGFEDLFSRVVDGDQVDFVRPLEDSGRLVWVAYDSGNPLGTLTGSVDAEGVSWRLSTTHEHHRILDDAVRALRRPASWPRERAQVARWARPTPASPAARRPPPI